MCCFSFFIKATSSIDDGFSESWHPFTFPMKLYMEVGEEMTARAAPMAARLGWILAISDGNEGQVSRSENYDRLTAWENKKFHSRSLISIMSPCYGTFWHIYQIQFHE